MLPQGNLEPLPKPFVRTAGDPALYCRPADIWYHLAYVASTLPEDCANVHAAVPRNARILRPLLKEVVLGGDWDLPRVPLRAQFTWTLKAEQIAEICERLLEERPRKSGAS